MRKCLVSPLDKDQKIDINYFANFAEKNIYFDALRKFLVPPKTKLINLNNKFNFKINKNKPIAIAEDKIFHFQYPETKEFLNDIGIPLISWSIFNDEEIPSEASSLIVPGGFPEKYAQHISFSEKSLNSLKKFRQRGFIYAECGGMMILGKSIEDENGNIHKMSGLLPFKSKKSKLSVGYRYIKGLNDSPIIKRNQLIKGHEFHYWELDNSLSNKDIKSDSRGKKLLSPWEIKSCDTQFKIEGWSDNRLHASWVHLHLPSSPEAVSNFIEATQGDFV